MLIAIGQKVGEVLHSAGMFIYGLATSLGGPGLFLVALADSSFLSVPEGNDLLIVILSTGKSWGTMSYYVSMTVLGSIAGCSLLYWVGRRGGRFMERRPRREKLDQMRKRYDRWGVWAVLVPSILPPPTPFKVFVLSAGVFKLSFNKFLFAVAIGRSIRYFIWGILAVLYGEAAKRFLEENMTAVGLALVGLIVLTLGLIMIRRLRKKAVEAESV